MALIEIKNMTKDYGNGRGVFDLSLEIEEGEVFGYVGTNGAGKTTTLRHLMGFLKPQSGNAFINELNCWTESNEIKKIVGYVPGEIAFPDAPTGTEFLRRQAELLGLADMSYADEIIEKLQLDPTANLKRMSKGMKQKTAIVAAFMANPKILILDEPTTGLDPLMRVGFIDIIKNEKKKGKTIIMSSHMFEELEDTCDRVALINDGKITVIKKISEIKYNEKKTFKVEFKTKEQYVKFIKEELDIVEKREKQKQVIIKISDHEINTLTNLLKNYDLKFINEIKFTLEEYFKNFY